ncbi:MAG: hypothetical protein F4039_07445 [Gammaproteobacteria bacterium]|nr:hypothetical protein [Gammaproteobacteria bacterium]MXX94364.1 hypothetical protein [Gammaproteobacteria bacterium]MYK43904.1 hypothetical protein [Gammaproteobacteria bacterium]
MSPVLSGFANMFKFAGYKEQVPCLAATRIGVEVGADEATFWYHRPEVPGFVTAPFLGINTSPGPGYRYY